MTAAYQEAVLAHRRQKDEKIKADPLHWMNLAGLFWLEEGENSFGAEETNKIAHPAFPLPFCGNFTLDEGAVFFRPTPELNFSSRRAGITERRLTPEGRNDTDIIEINSLTIKIIIRGGMPLIRMWDRDAPEKASFTSLKYYPVKPEYRISADYFRYDPPKTVIKTEIIGTKVEAAILGKVKFQLHGVDCELEAEKSGEKLLLHFADATNGKTTYGGGRRLYVPPPEGDELILDFNYTDNWPCAYTPYATCPIVPPQNRLPISIEAGELKYYD
jgi:hypothetical protein